MSANAIRFVADKVTQAGVRSLRSPRNIAFVCFLLCNGWILLDYKLDQNRVFILHSYDPSYTRARDIDAGIRLALDSGTERYALRTYYMDAKRRDINSTVTSAAIDHLEGFNPNYIIGIDDDAHRRVIRTYVKRCERQGQLCNLEHILFAGINDIEKASPYLHGDARGIVETKPVAALASTIRQVSFKGKSLGDLNRPLRVQFPGDESASVKSDIDQVIERGDEFGWEILPPLRSGLLKDWADTVTAEKDWADLFVIFNYQRVYRAVDCPECRVPACKILETVHGLTGRRTGRIHGRRWGTLRYRHVRLRTGIARCLVDLPVGRP